MPRTPTDYSKTLMYKIVCKDLDITDCFVGHTTDFRKRKYEHKKRCNDSTNAKHNLHIYKEIRKHQGWENWDVIEIEKFPCKDNNEARTRERFWYEELNSTLNTYKPLTTKLEMNQRKNFFRTLNFEINKFRLRKTDNLRYIRDREKRLLAAKEYYKNHQQEREEYRKDYYDANKTRILQRAKDYRDKNRDLINERARERWNANKHTTI